MKHLPHAVAIVDPRNLGILASLVPRTQVGAELLDHLADSISVSAKHILGFRGFKGSGFRQHLDYLADRIALWVIASLRIDHVIHFSCLGCVHDFDSGYRLQYCSIKWSPGRDGLLVIAVIQSALEDVGQASVCVAREVGGISPARFVSASPIWPKCTTSGAVSFHDTEPRLSDRYPIAGFAR